MRNFNPLDMQGQEIVNCPSIPTDAVTSGDFIQLLKDNTDDALSATSELPVQNKVVKAAIEGVSVNPLQLGEARNVTLPFTPTSDGILSVIVSNPSESGTATAYIGVNGTQAFTVQGFGGAIGTGDFAIKQGQRITLRQSVGGNEVTYKFTPFLPTTGEPVMQTYDATSQKPISGVGVAAALAYSTEEKRIGTWIDGKPLYRKTMVKGAFESGEQAITSGIPANIDHIHMGLGTGGVRNEPSGYFIANCYNTSNHEVQFIVEAKSDRLYLNAYAPEGWAKAFFVMEYTKTTD